MTALAQTIEAGLDAREPDELAAAYRRLCAMMLRHTAMSLRRVSLRCKGDAFSKRASRHWLHEGGVLSFSECCDCLSFPESSARRAITQCADSHRSLSITTSQEKCCT